MAGGSSKNVQGDSLHTAFSLLKYFCKYGNKYLLWIPEDHSKAKLLSGGEKLMSEALTRSVYRHLSKSVLANLPKLFQLPQA